MATQHPIPGELSSLLSLRKLLFCQAHVDVLKQQHGISACAPASWGTNVCHSTFVTEFSAEFSTQPACEGAKCSQDGLLPPIVPSLSWSQHVILLPCGEVCDTGRYLPIEPRYTAAHQKLLFAAEGLFPSLITTHQKRKKKRSNQILNAEMLRKEKQIKD